MNETIPDNLNMPERLHIKTRNGIQVEIIKQMLSLGMIADESVWYDLYGQKVTDILNDRNLNEEIENLVKDSGHAGAAHFIIEKIKKEEIEHRHAA